MYNGYKCDAIIQARMGSSRLPGKALIFLEGKPVLQHIIERLRRSKYIDDVIVATTTNEADNPIIELCQSLNCSFYRGSEEDVLQRVLDTALHYKTDIIVEVTADCPMADPMVADEIIEGLVSKHFHYCSNVVIRTYPRGFDIQAFWTVALNRVNNEVDNEVDRQHVSTWFYKNPKSKGKYNICSNTLDDVDLSHIRLTLDTEEDYKTLQKVFSLFNDNTFSYQDIIHLCKANTNLFSTNSHIQQKDYDKELAEWNKNIASY
jgi:spore coat polysaccharide biosynthesis protein SpsF